MALEIRDAELLAVTESSATVSFCVCDGDTPVDAEARLRVGGALRASASGAGTRLVRVEGLAPGTRQSIEIEVKGAAAPAASEWWPASFETLPAPQASQVAR